MRKPTIQIRANIHIDDALILDMLRDKEKRPIGLILSEMLNGSPQWQSAKKKLLDFKEGF